MVSWKIIAGSTAGGTTLVSLFAYLFLLSGMDYSFTGDSVCDQLECSAYIDVNTSTWTVCFDHPSDSQRMYYPDWASGGKLARTTIGETNATIYKKSRFGRTLWVNLNNVDMIISTDPVIPVDWYVSTNKKYADHKDDYGYWRPIKDGDCWERSSKPNRNKLIGHAKIGQVIKWNFQISDKVDIDPIWISWDYTYENLSYPDPIYEKTLVIVDSVYSEKYNNWSRAYNYTEITSIGYKTIYYDGKRTGLKVGNITKGYNANVDGDILCEWSISIGGRNFDRRPCCIDYVKAKGLCKETNLLNLLS